MRIFFKLWISSWILIQIIFKTSACNIFTVKDDIKKQTEYSLWASKEWKCSWEQAGLGKHEI